MSSFPQKFWNEKILKWEQSRYGGEQDGLLENLASSASKSLKYRMEVTMELLTPHLEGKSVLELGCGSGRLAADIINAGAKSYCGMDIASLAIDSANKRYTSSDISEKILFKVGGVEELEVKNFDIVFSIGLLDWLTDDAIGDLIAKSTQIDFLHSYSEQRVDLKQLLHKAYVYLAYGYRSNGYVPRYYSEEFIREISHNYGINNLNFFRDRRLSFGTFVSTLDIPSHIFDAK
jgi:SAM-dependent methyltransferase